MSRYFFDLWKGSAVSDTVGVELADEAAVRAEAVRRMSDLMAQDAGLFDGASEWRIDVSDEAGAAVLSLVVIGSAGRSGA